MVVKCLMNIFESCSYIIVYKIGRFKAVFWIPYMEIIFDFLLPGFTYSMPSI